MRRRTAVTTTLAFAALVVLAGCLGAVGGGGGTGASTTQTPPPPDTPASADGAGTGTPTSAPSGTPTQTYVAPTEPNRPTETATRNASGNRILAAKFVNKVKSSDGKGYSHFDIRMLANTSMKRIDPPQVEGDVEGEPYALVLVNGKLVERTSYLEMRDRGRYTIDVRMAGFAHNNIKPGKLNVRVLLMDQDSTSGDVYGTWTGTIRYAK